MEPKVAIVLPCCNSMPYLQFAVESIFNSTNFPFKLILVENGSTDGTSKYCDELAKKDNVEVYHIPKRGLPNATNFGIKKAGDLDVYLTQDDVIHFKLLGRDWLMEMYNVSKNQETGQITTLNGGGISGKEYLEGLRWVGTWSNYIPRRTIKEVGLFDEKMRCGTGMDVDYSYRILKKNKKISIINCWVQHHRLTNHGNVDDHAVIMKMAKYFRTKHKLGEHKMNIIFYSLIGSRNDYFTDGLLYGLKKLYNVIDIPKRTVLYKDSSGGFYSNKKLWHFRNLVDNVDRETYIKPDLIIYDSAVLYKQSNIPSICLLTNDPFDHPPNHVYPNIRIDKPMAIREKCMQTKEINRKEIKDFPLYCTTSKEDCKYVDSSLRQGIWVSFLYPTKEREEIIEEFGNTKYATKEDYYNSLRKAKYGISINGLGYLCSRSIEIAGNCLLCKKRQPKWEYTDLDYKDGKTCIEFSTIKELKDKMKYYDEHPKEYEKLLKNCYNHTIKYFIYEAQAARLVKWGMKNGH